MLAGGLRVALRFHRFFLTLGVFALAVMFGSSPMALRRVFVMFRRLGMSFFRHAGLSLVRVAIPTERRKRHHRSRRSAGSLPQIISSQIVSSRSRFESRYVAGPLEHRRRQRVTSPVNPAQREEELDAWVGGRLSCHCFDRSALGYGVLAGTAFAAAKIIFVLALLAFLISAVVEVSRRGAP